MISNAADAFPLLKRQECDQSPMDAPTKMLQERTLSSVETSSSQTVGGEVAGILLMSVFTIAALVRVWSRLCATKHGLLWDDWFALIAWPFGMYFCLIVTLQFAGQTTKPGLKTATYAANACYYMSFFFIKGSALFFYNRAFGLSGKFKKILWIVGAFNLIVALTFAFTASFFCLPVQKIQHPNVDGHCDNIEAIYLVGTTLSVITDVITLILPMYPLWILQKLKARKLILATVFFFGYSVPLLSLIKLGYVAKEVADEAHHNGDKRSSFLTPLTLTVIETSLGLICIHLPAMFSMYLHLKKHGSSAMIRSFSSSEQKLVSKSTGFAGEDSITAPSVKLSQKSKNSILELKSMSSSRVEAEMPDDT